MEKLEPNKNEEEPKEEDKKEICNNNEESDESEGEKTPKNYENELDNLNNAINIEESVKNSINRKENTNRDTLKQAEIINFQSLPSQIIKKNQFGFVKTENSQEKIDPKTLQKNKLKINARIEKWNTMLAKYNKFKGTKKLQSRTRKGIPDNLRGRVWQLFANMESYYKPGLYESLCKEEDKEAETENEKVILRDLDRTFPNNSYFSNKYGQGQRDLYHVLLAYSRYNQETGYVQGMGYIVAVLLTYMPAESSFFMLDIMLKQYHLIGLYRPNFPDLDKMFYTFLYLLKKNVPTVYNIFKNNGIMPSMFASEWFITLFSKDLEFSFLCRIFDVFFLEGYKVIYRFAIAFIKLKEAEFIKEGKNGLQGIVPLSKQILETINYDVEVLFKVAFKFNIEYPLLDKIEDEYLEEKKKPYQQKNEIMKMISPD